MLRRLYKFYRTHFYSLNGAFVGLLIGLSVHFLGIFATIFLALCIFAGYWVGKQIQKDRSFLRNLLDKILPPGSYR
ncbi:MAG: DUF2273 domain-containing protein [Clostridia bacterium]|jgi:uncharacterized membrane protein|nr:DUF2273 domain-containing protein [Clostridia bacterium]